jgi:Tfp pilus assembly protein PilO
MNGRPTTKTVLAGVVLAALAAVALYTAVWQPRAAEAENLRRDQAQISASLAQLDQRLDTAVAAQADAAALGAQAAAALAAIPSAADLDGLIAAHRDAAAAAGVNELEVAPETGATDSGIPGISAESLRVSLRGDAANIRDYVARIEALPRLVVVDRLSTAVEGGGQMTASLTLRAFHSGASAPTAIVAVPTPTLAPVPAAGSEPVPIPNLPATEQPAAEQPATEQPATEQPATEQPATEQPAIGQPAPAAQG